MYKEFQVEKANPNQHRILKPNIGEMDGLLGVDATLMLPTGREEFAKQLPAGLKNCSLS